MVINMDFTGRGSKVDKIGQARMARMAASKASQAGMARRSLHTTSISHGPTGEAAKWYRELLDCRERLARMDGDLRAATDALAMANQTVERLYAEVDRLTEELHREKTKSQKARKPQKDVKASKEVKEAKEDGQATSVTTPMLGAEA